MDATERFRTRAGVLRELQARGVLIPSGVTKTDVDATIAAIDDFLTSNAAAINAAFPQPFRGAADAQLKAIIVGVVAFRRAGWLRVAEDVA